MKRREFIWCLATLAAPAMLAGCQTLPSDTSAPGDKTESTWHKLFRPSGAKRKSFFTNEKSWEIEEHLDQQRPAASL